MRDSYRSFFQNSNKNKLIFGAFVLMILVINANTLLAAPPEGTFYYPPGHTPPGPPPNYNMVDTSYLSGTPILPLPPPDSGGIYIWVDSSGWNVANHIYSRGNSYEQFHGSVLAILDSPPSPGDNIFANGFELFGDTTGNLCYKQNDRWGWYQWSENLYEIWWDVTTREWIQGDGDPNDFMVINITGCAIDFNVWSSGHGGPFDTDQVFLGGSMFPLSNVPGFVDTYPGITDPYQSQAGSDPEHDPNITIFTAISGTGESYNKDGLIVLGQTYDCGQVFGQDYGNLFTGPFVYEGNGIQFSSSCLSDPCQFNDPPVANSPADTAIFVCDLNEICLPGFSFSDPNNNILFYEVIGGTLYGDTICFTPVAGNNALTLIVTDECGESDTVTTNIVITLNSPPSVTCPNDTSIFVCDLSEICIPGFGYSDPDGNQTYFEVIGGVYNNGTVCLTPVVGLNIITMIKGDSCGERDTCETIITVTLNSSPIADSPNDTSMFVCDLSQKCLPGFTASDPDGNIISVEVNGGTLSGDTVCFTPVEGLNTITLIVTDACGETDTATTVVSVDLNEPPIADSPNDTSMFVCDLSQKCLPGFTASDPDGNIISVEINGGTLSGDTVCFTPVEGPNTITLIVTDACGEADTATTVVSVDLNEPPVADSPNDTSMFVCDLSQKCLPGFTMSDPDGNIASVEVYGGTLSGDTVCFTPVEGLNTITLILTDTCGEADTATTVVSVDLNEPPVADSPNDTSMFVCDLSQKCLPGFTASDPDGNIVSVEVNGGTLSGDTVCFTPVEGQNTITLIVTDACGEADTVTTIITVTVNSAPAVSCPGDTVVLFVCETAEICVGPFVSSDTDSNIDSSYIVTEGFSGTFDGSSFCFTPNLPAVYQIKYIALDSCGQADTCSINVDVQMTNEPPTVFCPGDTTILSCDLSNLCLPGFGYADDNNNLETIDIFGGTFDNGNICFTPVEGENIIAITVTDSCGLSATCTTLVTIILNSSPVITCINDTTLVVDDLAEVCLDSINITDAEDNIASVYVNGDSMTGEAICFTAVPGINTVTIIVTDSCGQADTCVVEITVGFCAYIPGDANADMAVNGLDITIMVNFFKMGPALPDTCDCRPDLDIYPFFGAGDTNGSCVFNGLDVTYLYKYLISEVDEVLYCPSCPPTGGWVASVESGEFPKVATSKPGEKPGFNSLK